MAKGFKYGGYIGQILRVNLNNKGISKEPLREDWARDFVGGTGLGARIFYEEVGPKIDPLGPENKLMIMTGPANGTMIPSASRTAVCAKSPYTHSFFHSIFGVFLARRLNLPDTTASFSKARRAVRYTSGSMMIGLRLGMQNIFGERTHSRHKRSSVRRSGTRRSILPRSALQGRKELLMQ